MKRRCLHSIILFLILFAAVAQQHKVDSLEKLLSVTTHDTLKMKLYMQLCEVCEIKDNLKYSEAGLKVTEHLEAKKYFNFSNEKLLRTKTDFLSALAIYYSEWNKNYTKLISTHQELALLYAKLKDTLQEENEHMKVAENIFLAGNSSRAFDTVISRLKFYERKKNEKWIAFWLSKMGDAYMVTGNMNKSIEYYQKSLRSHRKLKDEEQISGLVMRIGEMYHNMGDDKKSLEWRLEQKKLVESSGNKTRICHTYFHIAETYKNLFDTTNAFKYNRLACALAKEQNDLMAIGAALRQKGQIYYWVLKDIKNALLYSQQGLQFMKQSGNQEALFGGLRTVAKISLVDKNFKQALKYAQEAEKIASDSQNFYDISSINQLLYEIYSAMENYKSALQHHLTYLRFKDSTDHLENRTELEKKSMKYEFDKSELALRAEQDKINLKAKEDKEKQILIIYSVSGALLLIIIFAVFILRTLNTTRKQKLIIEQQKHIVEEKHKEISDSINYAERIQKSFLATKSHLDENLNAGTDPEALEGSDFLNVASRASATNSSNYFVLFKPKDVVSGDFYWSATLSSPQGGGEGGGLFALCTADSTGHGVPGAIMSLLNITSLEKAIETETSPDKILNTTRKIIIERLIKDGSTEGGKDGMDCSLCVLDFKNNKLFVANANNPVWIVRNVIRSGSEGSQERDASLSLSMTENEVIEVKADLSPVTENVIEVKGDKMPVGKHDKQDVPFTLKEYELQKGDIVYTLTDGFPDQFGGEKGKKFMSKNLRELLVANSSLPMKEQKDLLEKTFTDWVGNLEQVDDVTVIGIKI